MKKVYLFSFVVLLYSCNNHRLHRLESNINSYVSEQKPNIKFTLVLDTISSFKWDELLIAGPYTDLKKIERYNLNRFPNSIKHHDKFTFLGFINKAKGVKWINLKGNSTFSETIQGGYKIYPKSDTKFYLKK